MAFTSANLTSVEAAILSLASGSRVATVTIDGETIEYTSTTLPALLALRAQIKSDVDKAAGTARYHRLVTSKGY